MARRESAYEGASFIVVEPNGDILPGREGGLYHEDTRFLSMHTLRLSGKEPLLLSSRTPAPHLCVVFATNPALPELPQGSLVIRRAYAVGGGLHADVDIQSHAPGPVAFDLELAYDADFADVFEVKRHIEAASAEPCPPARAMLLGRSVLALARAGGSGFQRRAEIRFSVRPVFEDRAARLHVELGPGESFHLCQDVFTIAGGDFTPPRHRCAGLSAGEEGTAWTPTEVSLPADRPLLRSDDGALEQAFERAVTDLYALRIHRPEAASDDFHLAAGVPWFMALFGRDSLIAASQSLPYAPDLTRGVLRSLARRQGRKVDPETEEQPGKILHEDRPECLPGARSFAPRFPYYGSIDSTPLFVIVLGEHYRRTGDLDFVRSLEPNLAAAVRWIQTEGDPDCDGFLEYRRSTSYGLWNQGWKDSDDSVRFRDGRRGEPPIALVEVQGYAVAALRSAAELYRALGRDEAESSALERRAEELSQAIDRAFWMEERQTFAMALDASKRQVDALTSNPAHLLWSGAARPERAEHLARTLLSPDLCAGFGLRTMGNREAAYSPISYHNGSVWPHDTSIAAAGLARYGRRAEATALASSLLDAVEHYPERRLPELFAGLSRERTPFPVEYPTSNSPQAWAAGAILLVTTTLLGLSIDVPQKRLRVRPCLPDRTGMIRLSGLRVGGSVVQIEVKKSEEGVITQVQGAPAGFSVDTGD